MIKRTIEIANPATLRVAHRQLILKRESQPDVSIPIEDIGLLLIANQEVSLSLHVLLSCAEAGAAVVACDAKFSPAVVSHPLWGKGHDLSGKYLREQVELPHPRRKQIWREIVKAKIRAQQNTLEILGLPVDLLSPLPNKVLADDHSNVEAQAARYYWRLLFGKGFKRNQDEPGLNALLNYGYAIVRSCVFRAIVTSGMHACIGFHHSNQYNAAPLADDLMEPFRPLVDRLVVRAAELFESDEQPALTRDCRAIILGILSHELRVDGRSLPFQLALQSFVVAVRDSMSSKKVSIPTLQFDT